MLNCRQATEVCSDEMERPLSLGEQVPLRVHLMMCTGCANCRRQLKMLRQAMRAYADGKAVTNEPDAGLTD